MKCSKCGAELKENAKFCSKCGSAVEVKTDSFDDEEMINKSNYEQTKAVKKALELTIKLNDANKVLNEYVSECFDQVPKEPQYIEPQLIPYPAIDPPKFNWAIALIPCIICPPWILIYWFYHNYSTQSYIENTKNSPQYISQCNQIDFQNNQLKNNEYQKYLNDKQEYDETIYPKYKSELDNWTAEHEKRVSMQESVVNELSDMLSIHYRKSGIIPLQYREQDTLQYLYDMMSTSDYDIKEAINMFDKNTQRQIDIAKIQSQEESNNLLYEQNTLAMEQNSLLNEQNRIADQARREAKLQAFVGAVQTHNTNKALNKMTKD